ncbi:MAG: SAM-dependent methyltransferase [Schleiferiaceae bacterium]|nr:SAM-dependent methyltransferase [Schleiferiaceae bacterium]
MADNPDYGTLYLIPSLLGDTEPLEVLPMKVKKVIDQTQHFIVENEKSARSFIKKVTPSKSQPQLILSVLNKYTEEIEYEGMLEPCLLGHDVGIISEAGVPCLADPGSEIVNLAHKKGVNVVPLSGPSSILMGLIASGLNGQKFTFNGYLPIESAKRKKMLISLEKLSLKGSTQIFMETPYRNAKLLEDVLAACDRNTRLCVATDISLQTEMIKTKTISEWKKNPPELHKRPTIFLISAS